MKTLACILGGIVLGVSAGYSQEIHDLAVNEIVEPGGHWVEDGAAVTPALKIVNLGNTAEENVPVKLVIINEDEDTVYEEATILDRIEPGSGIVPGGDTVEVEFPEWIPAGTCQDWQEMADGPPDIEDVGMYYELTGIVSLILVADRDPGNDTLRDTTICLLSHDVGVVDLNNEEGHGWGQDHPAGTEFSIVATVENFGYNEEHDVDVDIEILDVNIDPDSLVWHTVESVEHLDWRGNDLGNPYRQEVCFPTWSAPEEGCFKIHCRTELVGDNCPVNNEWQSLDIGVAEKNTNPSSCFSLEVIKLDPKGCNYLVMFTLHSAMVIEMAVYDINGSRIHTLAAETFQPGEHTLTWNGIDERGNKVSAGIYLIRMEAGGFEAARKVVIVQ